MDEHTTPPPADEVDLPEPEGDLDEPGERDADDVEAEPEPIDENE